MLHSGLSPFLLLVFLFLKDIGFLSQTCRFVNIPFFLEDLAIALVLYKAFVLLEKDILTIENKCLMEAESNEQLL